ncbi:MAG: hypothetical protein FWC43_14345, partial [Planctomycetaceae bacterium]|nr:hypothetical protein [Planctomycetaceae bacterium]
GEANEFNSIHLKIRNIHNSFDNNRLAHYTVKVQGQRGKDRYENYPTYYHANTAGAVKGYTPLFSKHYFAYWHRYGELDHYLPQALRPLGWGIDTLSMAGVIPRQVFIIGLQK